MLLISWQAKGPLGVVLRKFLICVLWTVEVTDQRHPILPLLVYQRLYHCLEHWFF